MNKKLFLFTTLSFAATLFLTPLHAKKLVGADVSWCTEMENEGKTFCDSKGNKRELMQLLHDIGMRAVRLRVWVNPAFSATPSEKCYGSAYCDVADVVAKAKRAKSAGHDIMIDFHYSDFFTDPGKQNVPNNWQGKTFSEVKALLQNHTTLVLEALKTENILPKWIQIGNETASGMLYGYGDITWSPKDFSRFVELYNAGYDAAKTVCPDALVMPHKEKGSSDNIWWFNDFKWAGGKFDMIALSHYPQTDNPSLSPAELNSALAEQVKKLHDTHGVNIMISEVGVKVNDNEALATEILSDLSSKVNSMDECAGIFYWEPELYGWWKPKAYNALGWNAYNMGAFYRNGSPSKAIVSFIEQATGTETVMESHKTVSHNTWHTINGQRVSVPHNGVYITAGRKYLK